MLFREVLDALINKNYAEKEVSVADEAMGNALLPDSPLVVLDAPIDGDLEHQLAEARHLHLRGRPVTPRRQAMAIIYAKSCCGPSCGEEARGA